MRACFCEPGADNFLLDEKEQAISTSWQRTQRSSLANSRALRLPVSLSNLIPRETPRVVMGAHICLNMFFVLAQASGSNNMDDALRDFDDDANEPDGHESSSDAHDDVHNEEDRDGEEKRKEQDSTAPSSRGLRTIVDGDEGEEEDEDSHS